jgi:hypothetical protein
MRRPAQIGRHLWNRRQHHRLVKRCQQNTHNNPADYPHFVGMAVIAPNLVHGWRYTGWDCLDVALHQINLLMMLTRFAPGPLRDKHIFRKPRYAGVIERFFHAAAKINAP